MNRTEFMNRFKKSIKRLPHDEYNDAISYYEEYFDDCEDENQAILGLGSPESVATKILADYLDANPKKINGYKIWLVILSIFAAPIALPLAIAFGCIAFAIVITILSVAFAFIVTAIAIVITGVAGAILSFAFILESPATIMFFVGLGSFSIGFGILFFRLAVWLGKKSIALFLKLQAKVLRRFAK